MSKEHPMTYRSRAIEAHRAEAGDDHDDLNDYDLEADFFDPETGEEL